MDNTDSEIFKQADGRETDQNKARMESREEKTRLTLITKIDLKN